MGRAITLAEDNCSVSGVNIVGNRNPYGAGCWLGGENDSISNCTIAGNEATYGAGGIYDNNDDNSISNCSIMYNNCKYGEYGGVYVTWTCDVILSGL